MILHGVTTSDFSMDNRVVLTIFPIASGRYCASRNKADEITSRVEHIASLYSIQLIRKCSNRIPANSLKMQKRSYVIIGTMFKDMNLGNHKSFMINQIFDEFKQMKKKKTKTYGSKK